MYRYGDLRKTQLPFENWKKVGVGVRGKRGLGGMGKGRLWSIVPSCG